MNRWEESDYVINDTKREREREKKTKRKQMNNISFFFFQRVIGHKAN